MIRTPALSVLDKEILTEQLLLTNPDFLTTYDENDEKWKRTKLKYLIRNKYRCTPFGLSAGIGIGIIGPDTNLVIDDKQYSRHTRLGMEYLYDLCVFLNTDKFIKRNVKYYSNNSCYDTAGKLRYIETAVKDNNRSFFLASISIDSYILTILSKAKEGNYIKDLLQCIDDSDITDLEKEEYFDDLIDCQLLISDLTLNVTGSCTLRRIINILTEIIESNPQSDTSHVWNILNKLTLIDALLSKIDDSINSEFNLQIYTKIHEVLDSIGIPYDKKKIFHCDRYSKYINCEVSKEIPDNIAKSIHVIAKLTPTITNRNLEIFKKAFLDRWETREIPLLLALDNDIGIGYPVRNEGTKRELFDTREIDFKLYEFWAKRIYNAIAHGQTVIDITDDELSSFDDKTNLLSPTFATLFSLINLDGKQHIYIKHIGGSTATYLLGRFCHNERINNFVTTIATLEKQCLSNKIVAEICCLPNSTHIGNIVQRPHLREYEISCLTQSTIESNRNISLDDILVAIRDNKIVLTSKTRNIEIVPRLSTAHEYRHNTFPLYYFLSDLQFENKQRGLGLDLSLFNLFIKYIPRITYNQSVIVEPAKWFFDHQDLEHLYNVRRNPDKLVPLFKDFVSQHRLPKYISLALKTELIIDTEDTESILLFINEAKKINKICITECFVDFDSQMVKNPAGKKRYTNEIACFFYKDEPRSILEENDNLGIKTRKGASNIHANFLPGSEWLYYKIYTGEKSSNDILIQIYERIIKEYALKNIIVKWFFVRYMDPEYHIRLRLLIPDSSYLDMILGDINSLLQPNMDSEVIAKLQIETYKREVERYGIDKIEKIESIFWLDSIFNIETIISSKQETKAIPYFFFLIGAKLIDTYLTASGLDIDRKIEFTKRAITPKSQNNNVLNSHVREIYSQFKMHIDTFTRYLGDNDGLNNLYNHVANINIDNTKTIYDLIHMSLNRLFLINSNLNEYLLYCLTNRYYNQYKFKNIQK